MKSLAVVLLLSQLVPDVVSISVAGVYNRMLERERGYADTFAFDFYKPIGSKGGELIWPRSYSTSAELFFDENGAAYPLRPRPQLSQIFRPFRGAHALYHPNREEFQYRHRFRNHYRL